MPVALITDMVAVAVMQIMHNYQQYHHQQHPHQLHRLQQLHLLLHLLQQLHYHLHHLHHLQPLLHHNQYQIVPIVYVQIYILVLMDLPLLMMRTSSVAPGHMPHSYRFILMFWLQP